MYLWSGTLSVFSAKVRIAAAEKELELEIRDLPWTRANAWGEKPREFLAVSPRAEVPVLVRELYLKPDGAGRDEAAVAAATDVVATHHRRLEEALADQDFLCGAYSLADIGNFLAVAFAQTLGVPPEEGHEALGAWLRRVSERPVVAAEMQTIVAASAAA